MSRPRAQRGRKSQSQSLTHHHRIKSSAVQPPPTNLNWWRQVTQLKDIKDASMLQHQIAKQQMIYVLSKAIKNSMLPEVIAQIILNFIITQQIYETADNANLPFALQHTSLSPLSRIKLNNNMYTLRSSQYHTDHRPPKLWQANFKYCVGMEFKLKKDILVCGIDLDVHFGGVQVYAVLAAYKKLPKDCSKSIDANRVNGSENTTRMYDKQFVCKLIPCDHRQTVKVAHNQAANPQTEEVEYDRYNYVTHRFEKCSYSILTTTNRRNTQMIFTEMNEWTHGGLKLSAKNMMYRLGFVVSDGFYCNDYVNLKELNKKEWSIDENVKAVHWTMLNKTKLVAENDVSSFGQGLVEKDGKSNALKWFPKMRLITF